MGGSRLFSDFDPNGPAAPTLPPLVDVEASLNGNNLKWQTPDDNGSKLKSYKIYRGVSTGEPSVIGEVNAEKLTFRDRSTANKRLVYYQVTAVNAYGESPRTEKFYAEKSPSPIKGE